MQAVPAQPALCQSASLAILCHPSQSAPPCLPCYSASLASLLLVLPSLPVLPVPHLLLVLAIQPVLQDMPSLQGSQSSQSCSSPHPASLAFQPGMTGKASLVGFVPGWLCLSGWACQALLCLAAL